MFRLPGSQAVIAVGKVKRKHWLAAQKDYVKRIERYGRFDLVEVKDAVGRGLPDNAAMAREGELLLKKANAYQRLVLLTPEGVQLESEQLAHAWLRWSEMYGRVAFILGGPLGFSAEVRQASHETLSLSPLTFTHELARVLLLEQLYRACTILNNEPYHK